MSKVVLIYPPMVFGKKRGFGFPPLGSLYLASFLKEKGIDVKVIDAFIEGYTLEELKNEILKENPDIVGFSSMSCQVNQVLDIAKELKKTNPSIKIVVGGPHISSTKDELFNFTRDVDFLIYGEGEKAMHGFIEALEKGLPFEDVSGLIYRKEGKIMVNNPPQPIGDLDNLPFPDLSLVNLKKYDSYYARSLPLTSIMASRGCPFNCTFCDAYATHGKRLRLRSPGNIVEELERNYKEYDIKQVMIKDSTFTVNKRWVYEVCSEIKDRNLKINWTCNTRVDMVNEDILRAMKDAGCYMVFFGIESGSQKVLDKLNKGITIEQIKRGVSLCKKAGLETVGYFMIGSPGETEEDAKKTLEMAKKLKLDLATFGVTVAYPGTGIHKWAVENNALQNKAWYMNKDRKISKSIRESSGNLNLKDFPPEKQSELVKRINRSFYFRPSFILKQLFKLKRKENIKRAIKSVKELL
ncbi:B12-binding domain-containing radical SAM protein [Candidatus Woesearchaeota archaeon]|nr:B12-binding domain-containing radical SAM protein [Candidatus Woesearchaeota archaeon]